MDNVRVIVNCLICSPWSRIFSEFRSMKTQPMFRVKLAFSSTVRYQPAAESGNFREVIRNSENVKVIPFIQTTYRRRSGEKYAEWNKLMQQLFVRRK